MEDRQAELLPVPYFHIVFTLPQDLRRAVRSNQRILLAALCRAAYDALAALCRDQLEADPFSGWVFVFRSRSGTAIRVLVYDGQGFWLCQKRLSQGRLTWWPTSSQASERLSARELQILLWNGNPKAIELAEDWRRVA